MPVAYLARVLGEELFTDPAITLGRLCIRTSVKVGAASATSSSLVSYTQSYHLDCSSVIRRITMTGENTTTINGITMLDMDKTGNITERTKSVVEDEWLNGTVLGERYPNIKVAILTVPTDAV